MEYLLWDISFANLYLLLMSIPTQQSKENEPAGKGESVDTDSNKMKKAFAQFNF